MMGIRDYIDNGGWLFAASLSLFVASLGRLMWKVVTA